MLRLLALPNRRMVQLQWLLVVLHPQRQTPDLVVAVLGSKLLNSSNHLHHRMQALAWELAVVVPVGELPVAGVELSRPADQDERHD